LVAIYVEVPRSRDEVGPPPAQDLLEFDVRDVIVGLIGDVKVEDEALGERELVLHRVLNFTTHRPPYR
jgi:hypothetical protein